MGQSSVDIFVARSAGKILTDLGESNASMNSILSNYSVGSSNPKH